LVSGSNQPTEELLILDLQASRPQASGLEIENRWAVVQLDDNNVMNHDAAHVSSGQ
jgi:hypothetical protein